MRGIEAFMRSRARNELEKPPKHAWNFMPRFRRRSFGWRSQPAVARVREALAEIVKVAKSDAVLGGEGAVAFLERVSPALENVDSSSGSIGSAVNRAIETLAAIIAVAPVDVRMRETWLLRLWQAYLDDQMPYIEALADHWGELCASRDVASRWADEFSGQVRAIRKTFGRGEYSKATSPALSSLFAAERYDELLRLLEEESTLWAYRSWGVRALAAQGKRAEALRYAEASRSGPHADSAIARACEEVLLDSGLVEEAYARYAFEAVADVMPYVARFRALARRYPLKAPHDLLADVVAASPGEQGRWFATAKTVGLLDEAIRLANLTPCDPMTLARAARDFKEKNPRFALEASLAALRWIGAGYGYEIAPIDVARVRQCGSEAAELLGVGDEFARRVRSLESVRGA
jgi:hypothetical protein